MSSGTAEVVASVGIFLRTFIDRKPIFRLSHVAERRTSNLLSEFDHEKHHEFLRSDSLLIGL